MLSLKGNHRSNIASNQLHHSQLSNQQQQHQQQMTFYQQHHHQQQQQHTFPQSSFSDSAGINSNSASLVVGLCGGTPVREDVVKLKPNNAPSPLVVIATPGRLLDLVTRNVLDLNRVRYFVIDECDRILDMGMEEQLRRIVAMITVVNSNSSLSSSQVPVSSETPPTVEIRTSLWSATLPESLERIARSAVVDPVYVCCGIKNCVPQNIHQEVYTSLKLKLKRVECFSKNIF